MSQVNVNPPGQGGPYYGGDGGAAGVNLLAVVLVALVIIAIVVLAWGATAGHWFTGTTTNPGGNTTINVSAPARAPGASTGPALSPAPSR